MMDPTAPEPNVARLEGLLALCNSLGASDLHLSANRPPYARINGILKPAAGAAALSSADLLEVKAALLGSAPHRPLSEKGSIDGACTSRGGTRFRFNIFSRQGSLAVALRRLEDRLHTLAELGLPDVLYEVCAQAYGLVVVAGPTGSGKSTTLASLVDRVNQTRPCHIITIEDPIEYLHPPAQALVNQRQIGVDAPDFHEALVAALRQDPDVILVGEIRELHTIRTAITAAETGHLVLTTVHAGDCVGAVERLVSVFPAEEQLGVRRQLALVLRWVVAQQLLVADGPRVQKDGKETGVTSRRRVIASEILRNTSAVANLIGNGKSAQIVSSIEAGASLGMHTIEHDLARLMVQGYLSESTAQTLARNPAILRERAAILRRNSGGDASGRAAMGGDR